MDPSSTSNRPAVPFCRISQAATRPSALVNARATSKQDDDGVPSVSLRKRESVQGILGAGLPVDVSRTWQVTAGFLGDGMDIWEAMVRSLSAGVLAGVSACVGGGSLVLVEMSGASGVRDIVGVGGFYIIAGRWLYRLMMMMPGVWVFNQTASAYPCVRTSRTTTREVRGGCRQVSFFHFYFFFHNFTGRIRSVFRSPPACR